MTSPKNAASASLLGCMSLTAIALSWVGAQVAPAATGSTTVPTPVSRATTTSLTLEQQQLLSTIARERAALAKYRSTTTQPQGGNPSSQGGGTPSSTVPGTTPTTQPSTTRPTVTPTVPTTTPTTTPPTVWVPPTTVVTSGASGALR